MKGESFMDDFRKHRDADRIELIKGDITKLAAGAIVNAANNSLLGGGGVDGAIHRAAGRELYNECLKLNGCKTGEAKITKGYKLPAGHVIHTVGPVWHGGKNGEPELLASCYRNAIRLAIENSIKTIAFPSISTGVYGYPIDKAAVIALNAVLEMLAEYPEEKLEKVIFVCFNDDVYGRYEELLSAL